MLRIQGVLNGSSIGGKLPETQEKPKQSNLFRRLSLELVSLQDYTPRVFLYGEEGTCKFTTYKTESFGELRTLWELQTSQSMISE